MPINKQGVEQLKADLRANPRQYNQSVFGRLVEECGTEQCQAGYCLLRKIGTRAYRKIVRQWGIYSDVLHDQALLAAEEQLGVKLKRNRFGVSDCEGTIFDTAQRWPYDLYSRYDQAKFEQDYKAMVEVACDALDRLQVNGKIKELKEKVA